MGAIKGRTSSIGRDMRAIRTALSELLSDEAACEDIAFHLAEIRSEIDDAKEIIDSIRSSGKISPSHLKQLSYILGVHWPYHIRLLEKSLKRKTIGNALTKFKAQARLRQDGRAKGGAKRRPNSKAPSDDATSILMGLLIPQLLSAGHRTSVGTSEALFELIQIRSRSLQPSSDVLVYLHVFRGRLCFPAKPQDGGAQVQGDPQYIAPGFQPSSRFSARLQPLTRERLAVFPHAPAVSSRPG
jgi:hypothetical protein